MTLHPYNAWTLARLVYGDPADDDRLTALPGPFSAIARRLAGLPPDDRLGCWEAFLDGRDDRDAISRTLDDVDPDAPSPGPPGDDIVGTGDGWGPIDRGLETLVEPFPIDVFPEAIARLVLECEESMGCPPDFVALPVLAVAGGVIGRSVSLLLKPNYFVSASLFTACVGEPGDSKTPAFKVVRKAVGRITEPFLEEFILALQKWNNGKKDEPAPKLKRIDIDDATMEATVRILADNPRGLVKLSDELSALMLGMNQYKGGKGSDQPILLKIWSGDEIAVDRVTNKDGIPITCRHPFMSISGGIQPAMLGTMVDQNGRVNGFLDRFLFAYPDPRPHRDWSETGVPGDIIDDWCDLVARLWTRPMNVKAGRARSQVLHFTNDGRLTWIELYNAHIREMNDPAFPPSLRGPWGKLREYAGRLTLILACIDHASDPTAEPAAIPSVGARSVRDAWRLVTYFKSQTRRVHASIDAVPGSGGGVASAIEAWIQSKGLSAFSAHDVKQARRWITDDDLAKALPAMVRRNAIRKREATDEPDRKGGRPPSAVYDVNPSLLITQNP
jgi:hypothetical protein